MPPDRAIVLEATLTMADLTCLYCVSKRTIWRWVAEGRIPPPLAVTRRIRRWKASEIQQHLDSLKRVTR
jgi:predicted DNA-binding transcriptional regulator AlpA